MHCRSSAKLNRAQAAFSLAEVLVSVGVLGVVMISFYGGLGMGFSVVELNRENLRATQILEEKMEVVRLFNWDQVVNEPGYIPTNFTESFFSSGGTNSSGISYSGTVTVTIPPMTESYSNDLRLVTVTVTWKSGSANRQRQMSTFVGQYGLQKYIY